MSPDELKNEFRVKEDVDVPEGPVVALLEDTVRDPLVLRFSADNEEMPGLFQGFTVFGVLSHRLFPLLLYGGLQLRLFLNGAALRHIK
jgi:hypothetical protein